MYRWCNRMGRGTMSTPCHRHRQGLSKVGLAHPIVRISLRAPKISRDMSPDPLEGCLWQQPVPYQHFFWLCHCPLPPTFQTVASSSCALHPLLFAACFLHLCFIEPKSYIRDLVLACHTAPLKSSSSVRV